MPFELESVVPWGRNLDDYIRMFNLTDEDLDKKIIGFGDGPASFNAEMAGLGKRVISIDVIYDFSRRELSERIEETRREVLAQTEKNRDIFVWKQIRDIGHLESRRMGAMTIFLDDFESGKEEGRYVTHELPARTAYAGLEFDLALCSHLLFLYAGLGLQFHTDTIDEMLRISGEARIFPLADLNAEKPPFLDDIIGIYSPAFSVNIIKTGYEFHRNADSMLVIKRK
jgi:hypothetical protein